MFSVNTVLVFDGVFYLLSLRILTLAVHYIPIHIPCPFSELSYFGLSDSYVADRGSRAV